MVEKTDQKSFPKVKLNVNRKEYTVAVQPDTPLLWVIRDEIGLTGTKYGCGISRLRRLYRACGWKGSPVLPNSCFGCSGKGDHDNRRAFRGRKSPGSEGVDRGGCPAVRLLPFRPDNDRCRPFSGESNTIRRRH